MKLKNYLKLCVVCLCLMAILFAAQGVAFSASRYTITVSCGTGGKITPAGPNVRVYAGDNQNFTIKPKAGYSITDVVVDGSSVGAVTSYTFRRVQANHTISASFTPLVTYSITASAGQGGSITPSGTVTVISGSSKAFSIAPSSGYKIADVLVDAGSVGPVSSYTFSNVTAVHTIAASFAALPSNGQHAMVSVTMDDSWLSQYTNALPIMDRYNIKGTFYTVTTYVADEYPDFMSLDQLKALKGDGHEIASHTVTHPDLTTLGSKKLNAELANSKAWLENNGLGPIYDFACPYGEYNSTTIAATKQYYISQRSGYDEGFNSPGAFDPYKIKVQIVVNTTTLAEVSSWLAQAKADKTWLVLEYHQVDNSGDEYSLTPANFERQAQAIQASGVEAVTVKQALDEFALLGK